MKMTKGEKKCQPHTIHTQYSPGLKRQVLKQKTY